jgi:hypothetical protein
MCGSDFDDELQAWQEPTGCRYIVGHPHTDNWFYCQKKIQKGGALGNAVMPPYCDEHAELCVSPTFRMNRLLMEKLCALDSNVVARGHQHDDTALNDVDIFMQRTSSATPSARGLVKSQLNDMEFSSD